VNAWLTGGLTNNGFLVRMSGAFELASTDYYVKKFFARETFFNDKKPYLEARWDDSLKDDRNDFVFDNSGTLFLYNEVRGQLQDIPGIGSGSIYVQIQDSSGTLLVLTGSEIGQPGIYSCSFLLPTGSYSGSVFYDIWYSGSRAYMTGVFYPTDNFAQQSIDPSVFFVSMPNLKNQYRQTESPTIRIFTRRQDYNPAAVATMSSGPYGLTMYKAYYQIENDRTDAVVIPFGTGSPETTRLSYDLQGNYFRMYVSSLPTGSVYRVTLLYDVDGQQQLIDSSFKFKAI
jgi:hypothetical protein